MLKTVYRVRRRSLSSFALAATALQLAGGPVVASEESVVADVQPAAAPSNGQAGPVASLPSTNVPPGLIAIPPGSGGAPASMSPRLMLRLGGLERTAFALTQVLELYRLALVELVPATHAAATAGLQPGAQPSTQVPAAVRQVWLAWADKLAALPRQAGMPPLAWAYHSSLVDELREVGEAQNLGALLAPSQALLVNLGRQLNLTADVLNLLGAQRAVGVYNVEDERVAAEVRRSAKVLAKAMQQGGPNEAQDRAHLDDLEGALNDALNAVAFAEASGASTPERLGSNYLPLVQAQRSVAAHAADLTRVVATMAAVPPPTAGDLSALVREKSDDAVAVELHWAPPVRVHPGVSLLRVVRRIDVPAARVALDAAASCGALSTDAAANQLAYLLAHEAPEVVAQLPVDASSYGESLPASQRDWPRTYKVVASSAFGVEARAHEERARPAFASLQPPHSPRARSLAPRYDDAKFYRLADAVEVSWQPSASELDPQGGQRPGADVAVVTGYDVYRLVGTALPASGADDPALASLLPAAGTGSSPNDSQAWLSEVAPPGWSRVGSVAAGETTFVDRPAADVLAGGVAYVVVALAGDGAEARLPGSCGQSNVVRIDLTDAWRLARAGASRLARPTGDEQARTLTFAQPAALAEAQAAFASRPEAERRQMWQQFWQRMPAPDRAALQGNWLTTLSEAEADDARRDAPAHLCDNLRKWAHLVGYVEAEVQLQRAVAQFWQMLTPTERQDAQHSFRHVFGARFALAGGDALQANSAAGVARTAAEAGAQAELVDARDVQLWAWWQARDDEEKALLEQWWQAGTPAEQSEHLAAFWSQLSPGQRDAATFPELALLTAEERRAWLSYAPWPVPQKLMPAFLAFVAHDALTVAEKERAIAAELGFGRRALEGVHYAVRPLDVWLDFKLPLLLTLLAMGGLAGWLLQYAKGSDASR